MRQYQPTPDFYHDYIAHHGVLGMSWGVRNGPPYPLDRSISTGKSLKKSAKGQKNRNAKKDVKSKTKEAENKGLGLLAAYIATMYALPVAALAAGTVAEKISYKHNKKKISKLREKEEVDPKTGLHLKNKELTEKQDLKAVNPERKNMDNQEGAGSNCTFCTTAYDLRRRGYDVHAGTTIKGYTNSQIAEWYKNGKFTNIKQTTETLSSRKESVEHIKHSIVEKSGEGSRGNITVQWSGTFSGHSMVYEVKDGKVIILDGQSNTIYKNPDVILNRVEADSVSFMRTDNLKPNYEKLKKMGVIK